MKLRNFAVAAALSLAGLGVALPAQAETRLAFGATNSQSAHYAYFASLAKIINSAYPEAYQASVVETGATVDNLKRMARDQLDFGFDEDTDCAERDTAGFEYVAVFIA